MTVSQTASPAEQATGLYSAKQAAFIVSIDPTDLQIALDRDHIKATVVQTGARTYRRFTRNQLLSLLVFARMTGDGIKPSVARDYIFQMEEIVPQLAPIEFVVFGSGPAPAFIAKDDPIRDPIQELLKAIGSGAWVLPYARMAESLDNELRYIGHFDTIIGAEEPQGTEAETTS